MYDEVYTFKMYNEVYTNILLDKCMTTNYGKRLKSSSTSKKQRFLSLSDHTPLLAFCCVICRIIYYSDMFRGRENFK